MTRLVTISTSADRDHGPDQRVISPGFKWSCGRMACTSKNALEKKTDLDRLASI